MRNKRDLRAVIVFSFSVCYLCQMKIEVSYGIMKQLLQRHEFIKVGIPFCGVVHAAFPFVLLYRIDFFQKRKIDIVEDLSNSLMRKDLPLPSGAECIEPVEESRKRVQQPGEPSG